jgi:hypothetical protein
VAIALAQVWGVIAFNPSHRFTLQSSYPQTPCYQLRNHPTVEAPKRHGLYFVWGWAVFMQIGASGSQSAGKALRDFVSHQGCTDCKLLLNS